MTKNKKKERHGYNDNYEPIEDTLKTMCLDLLDCVGYYDDKMRKQKLAIGIIKTLTYRIKEGEKDLPSVCPKFVSPWQLEHLKMITDIQMIALANEIIYKLDERERGIITGD